jgi:hypothetical protein
MKKLLLLLILSVPMLASASVIDWYCPPHSGNVTGDENPLGKEFVFELGVFKDGFTPTPENISDWSKHWLPAQRTTYNEENQWFTSRLNVTDNGGGFSAGKKGWIWGFAGGPDSGEWILFRKDTWFWPAANPQNPLSRTWRATDANEFLVGGSTGTGAFQTSQVSGTVPPTTTWTQWRQQELGALAGADGVDVNENGIADVLEYILGARDAEDLLASRISIRMFKEGDITHTELVVARRADRPAVFDIEMSLDLKEWLPANTVVQLVDTQPEFLIYRDLSGAVNLEGPWFWRYKVTPAE